MLATGGIGRGYSNDYSDLDLIVYADHKKSKKIGNILLLFFCDIKTSSSIHRLNLTKKH